MKRVPLMLLTFVLCFATLAAPQTQPAVAFVGVNVLPMDRERVLKDHTVVTRGDRIVEVGPRSRVKPPQGAVVVESAGKYLMPGFAEMHGHIPPPGAPKEFVDAVLFLYVSNGVTTVRGMLGAAGQLELREKANRGEILSPTLYLAGPSFNGQSVRTPEQAIEKVRQQKSEGWDLLKIHPGVPRDAYDAMAKTAREVGLRWAGHVPADVGILHALESGQETIDHLDGYMEHLGGEKGPLPQEKLAEMARKTKAASAGVVPTMALWEVILGVRDLEKMRAYPELKYMPPNQIENWAGAYTKRTSDPKFDKAAMENAAANRKRLLKAMSDGGVTILFGTDAPQFFSVPGFSIHREIPMMVESGMTPWQILRSGTSNVGEYFKAKDKFGLVAAGHRADLVLLDANPLEDATNLARRSGVMVRGQWMAEREIQERLEKIAAGFQR